MPNKVIEESLYERWYTYRAMIISKAKEMMLNKRQYNIFFIYYKHVSFISDLFLLKIN